VADCLFCKIADGEIPARIVFQDEKAIAFEDINPQAPTHVIIVPRKHIPTVLDVAEEDQDLMGYLYVVANQIAADRSLTESGFRLVINCKKSAGQEVFHAHIHMLGGREFGWPPG